VTTQQIADLIEVLRAFVLIYLARTIGALVAYVFK
jgi:hypothetical protein